MVIDYCTRSEPALNARETKQTVWEGPTPAPGSSRLPAAGRCRGSAGSRRSPAQRCAAHPRMAGEAARSRVAKRLRARRVGAAPDYATAQPPWSGGQGGVLRCPQPHSHRFLSSWSGTKATGASCHGAWVVQSVHRLGIPVRDRLQKQTLHICVSVYTQIYTQTYVRLQLSKRGHVFRPMSRLG